MVGRRAAPRVVRVTVAVRRARRGGSRAMILSLRPDVTSAVAVLLAEDAAALAHFGEGTG